MLRAPGGHTAAMSQWWYCLRHSTVEEGAGCAGMERLGPYGSREEAAAAPQRTREQTEAEDARDRADGDWGRPPSRG